ncbi:MAG: hypothetical protein ACRCYU_07255 [Nocardioides sp.]
MLNPPGAPAPRNMFGDYWTHCRTLLDEPPGSDLGAYEHAKSDIALGDDLQFTVRRTIALDSEQIVTGLKLENPVELVPVSSPGYLGSVTVSVEAVGHRRTITPISPLALRAQDQKPDHSEEGIKAFLALALTKDEYTHFPVISIEAKSRFRTRGRNLLSWRQLLPVSVAKLEFGDPPGAVLPISINFPELATIDVTLLKARVVHWQPELSILNEVLSRLPLNGSDANRADRADLNMLITNLGTAYHSAHGILSSILTAQEDQTRLLASPTLRRKKLVPTPWKRELVELRTRIEEWNKKNPQTMATDQLRERSGKLIEILANTHPQFFFPAQVQEASIEPHALTAVIAGSQQRLSCNEIALPYTTPKDQNVRGKRSSLLLIFLSLVLASVALTDLSWLGGWDSGTWLRTTFPQRDPDDLREVLVALLLLFPAALYSQFFQSRPRSRLGSSARSGVFALLSLVFTLPIVPVTLIAIGRSLRQASIASATCAGICLAAGVLVWLGFAPTVLSYLRRSSLRRAHL